MGLRLLSHGYTALLAHFARTGVPAGMRGRVWCGALQVQLCERDYSYYAQLVTEISRISQVLDPLVKRDVAIPFNEEDYFVFCDKIEELVLCFMRDPAVLQKSAESGWHLRASNRAGQQSVFPPNGLLPPRGLSQYAFPLCYAFHAQEELYYLFRAMWTRYWCKLHCLSSRPGTLLHLLAVFESTLQELQPALCWHLLELELHPTTVAFPWILYAFSSYLPVEQVLLLWDRVVGFDSLLPLPVLAASIFAFRASALMQAQDADRARRILMDPSKLQVVPLLQAVLFVPSSLAI